jgi:hypothetical protein
MKSLASCLAPDYVMEHEFGIIGEGTSSMRTVITI